jgi:hypothetical protein
VDPNQIPLRDIHLPELLGIWPLAPGWWLLIATLTLFLALRIHTAFRRWRHNAPRRRALRELTRIRLEYDRGVDLVTLGKALSELLRRAMLAYAPRQDVAGLTGKRWLEWLDGGLDAKLFSEGPGRVLHVLPYIDTAGEDKDIDIDELIDVVRARLRTPLPEVSN